MTSHTVPMYVVILLPFLTLLLLFLLTLFYFLYLLRSPSSSSQSLNRSYYQNKTVWITGASSGIGKALAIQYHTVGAKLILSSRDTKQLQIVQQLCIDSSSAAAASTSTDNKARIKTYVPDILALDLAALASDYEVAKDIVAKAVELSAKGKEEEESGAQSGIDILINNAGASVRGSVVETQLSVDHTVMNINYFGSVALTKAILPHMLNRKRRTSPSSSSSSPNKASQDPCHIVFVSSIQGYLSLGMRSSYSASKHAINAFADALRYEVSSLPSSSSSSSPISITTVSPGYVATNLSLNAFTSTGSKYNRMDANTSQGMSPEYVAEVLINSVRTKEKEVKLCEKKFKIGILLKVLWPSMLEKIMVKRCREEREKLEKQEKEGEGQQKQGTGNVGVQKEEKKE